LKIKLEAKLRFKVLLTRSLRGKRSLYIFGDRYWTKTFPSTDSWKFSKSGIFLKLLPEIWELGKPTLAAITLIPLFPVPCSLFPISAL
jgi:hypothetical protein